MSNRRFGVCPYCDRKGWYLGTSEYDLENKLHKCRYCPSYEYISDTGKRLLSPTHDLLYALRELVKAADPKLNMSDIPVYDALGLARSVIARAGNPVVYSAATLGRKGGQSTSKAKQDAARKNGKKGGRPKKNVSQVAASPSA